MLLETTDAVVPPIHGHVHANKARATYHPDAVTHDDDTGMLILSFSLPEPGNRPEKMSKRFTDAQETARFVFSTEQLINFEEAY